MDKRERNPKDCRESVCRYNSGCGWDAILPVTKAVNCSSFLRFPAAPPFRPALATNPTFQVHSDSRIQVCVGNEVLVGGGVATVDFSSQPVVNGPAPLRIAHGAKASG